MTYVLYACIFQMFYMISRYYFDRIMLLTLVLFKKIVRMRRKGKRWKEFEGNALSGLLFKCS